MACRDDIEGRIARDGFEDLQTFVDHYVLSGYTFADLVLHIRWRLRIYYVYQTYRQAILPEYNKAKKCRTKKTLLERARQKRKMEKSGFQKLASYNKWERKARNLGFDSLTEAVRGLAFQGVSKKEMATIFGFSYGAFLRRAKWVK